MRSVTSLADIFRCENVQLGRATAYVFDGEPVTYAQLSCDANRYAQAMLTAGMSPNDRVAVMDKNSGVFPKLFGGALKARATLVPLNFRLSYEEVKFILADSGARLLLIGAEFSSIALQLRAHFDNLQIVFLQQPGEESAITSLTQWSDGASDEDPLLPNGPDDHVVQLYTSGTTGHPKGVYHSNTHYLTGMAALGRATQFIGDDETQLICMPLCHIAGLLNLLNGLLSGSRQVITREFNPLEVLELIEQHGVNTTLFAPVMIQVLVNLPEAQSTDFSTLKRIFYGSAPIAQSVLERAQATFGCDFWQLYGMTENIGMATFLPPQDHEPGRNKLLSCGKPYPDSELHIVDNQRRTLPPGEVGEIITRAQWTMPEYWHRPEASAQTLVDGWLYTGDAGYFDEEGYLYIHDRLKDMIVTGGENVYPAEVENALFAHSDVAEAAVFGVPDERWGEAVMAAVVLKPGGEASADKLIAFVREKIAAFKAPKDIVFIELLPRNTAGKVLKRELRAPYWEGKERSVG